MNRPSVLVALTLLTALGCSRFGSKDRIEVAGLLELTEHKVGARVAGRIVEANMEEGQDVKKGEVIARLNRFKQHLRDYERLVQVHRQGGTDDQTLERAKLDLEDQTVVSPVNGVILTQVMREGEVAPAGGVVAVIGDKAEMWVRVYVPEGQINRVRMGQEADVRFDGLEQIYKARVTYIAPKAEFTPRNVQTEEERVLQVFAVKVRLDNPSPTLRPGVSADVTLPLQPS